MKMNRSNLFKNKGILAVTVLLAGFVNVIHGATVTVTIVGYSFNPSSLTINVGDTVTWSGLINVHNVTGATPQDLNQFCGSSLTNFATETSCSQTFMTAGTFPYECSIHGPCGMKGSVTVLAATPTPTVTITNPVSSTIFTAPASVSISADASVSGGTVTNVAFFGQTNNVTTSLGAAQNAPFTITAANLAVGNYALTAVATAAGISATSAVVNITVNPPGPTVSITNPMNGAVFAAPAHVKIGATAVSSGTVTNVAFFTGGTVLGSATALPFGIIASNLAANAYALTAVATAAGVSTTSAVVNITVVTPVAVSNSMPGIAGGQFSFDYTANPGLTYVVESSLNLVNWVPIGTNIASTNPVIFMDSSGLGAQRFYQVVRQPNP